VVLQIVHIGRDLVKPFLGAYPKIPCFLDKIDTLAFVVFLTYIFVRKQIFKRSVRNLEGEKIPHANFLSMNFFFCMDNEKKTIKNFFCGK